MNEEAAFSYKEVSSCLNEQNIGGLYQNNSRHPICWRQLENLNSGVMQYQKAWPEENHVKETNHAEEERHINPFLVTDSFLHNHSVHPVQHSTKKRHEIANGNLPVRLMWK